MQPPPTQTATDKTPCFKTPETPSRHHPDQPTQPRRTPPWPQLQQTQLPPQPTHSPHQAPKPSLTPTVGADTDLSPLGKHPEFVKVSTMLPTLVEMVTYLYNTMRAEEEEPTARDTVKDPTDRDFLGQRPPTPSSQPVNPEPVQKPALVTPPTSAPTDPSRLKNRNSPPTSPRQCIKPGTLVAPSDQPPHPGHPPLSF